MPVLRIYNVNSPTVVFRQHGYDSVEHLQKELQHRNRDTCTKGWNKMCRRMGWEYKTVAPVPTGVAIFTHTPLRRYARQLIQIVALEDV